MILCDRRNRLYQFSNPVSLFVFYRESRDSLFIYLFIYLFCSLSRDGLNDFFFKFKHRIEWKDFTVFQRDIEVLLVSIEVFDTRGISNALDDPLYSICLYYLLNLFNPL